MTARAYCGCQVVPTIAPAPRDARTVAAELREAGRALADLAGQLADGAGNDALAVADATLAGAHLLLVELRAGRQR